MLKENFGFKNVEFLEQSISCVQDMGICLRIGESMSYAIAVVDGKEV
jgi:hypothetical protein